MAKKGMIVISSKEKDPFSMRSIKRFIGKKVISESGVPIGHAQDVLSNDNKVEGFILLKGLTKTFINKEFIADEGVKSIVLSIDPYTMLIGKRVFDGDGRDIGKVISVERIGCTNDFAGIFVKKHIFSKSIKIPSNKISVTKKNIILDEVLE